MGQPVEPLGVLREKLEAKESKRKAVKLAREVIQKTEQDKRRCKHPEHPTFFVNKHGKCRKAWQCLDYGSKGCVAVATVR